MNLEVLIGVVIPMILVAIAIVMAVTGVVADAPRVWKEFRLWRFQRFMRWAEKQEARAAEAYKQELARQWAAQRIEEERSKPCCFDEKENN